MNFLTDILHNGTPAEKLLYAIFALALLFAVVQFIRVRRSDRAWWREKGSSEAHLRAMMARQQKEREGDRYIGDGKA